MTQKKKKLMELVDYWIHLEDKQNARVYKKTGKRFIFVGWLARPQCEAPHNKL